MPALDSLLVLPRFTLHEITMDCLDAELVATFWSRLLGAELREPLPGWKRLGPLTDGGPVLNFQPVPEPKVGKSRMHLDLLTDDLTGAIRRVVELGGRELAERHVYEEGTVSVMADPEGHEFCLVQYTHAG
jgi:predicted enzyme related to lactoylglutathione lyase